MKKVVTSDRAPAVAGPYSPALDVDGWIFLAGQGGFDPATGELGGDDAESQTEQAFRNIAALLEEAGSSLADIVSCLVHLVDLADFAAMNAAFERQFPGIKPVRTTVRADLLVRHARRGDGDRTEGQRLAPRRGIRLRPGRVLLEERSLKAKEQAMRRDSFHLYRYLTLALAVFLVVSVLAGCGGKGGGGGGY